MATEHAVRLYSLRRRLLPLAFVLTLYFAVLVYPVLRLLTWCLPDWQPGTPELLAIMVGPALGRLSYEWRPGSITRALSAIALTWLGLCFLAFCVVAAAELPLLALSLPQPAAGRTLLAVVALLGLYSAWNAQRLQVRRVPVPAGPSLAGRTLAQISDVHIGSRHGRFLRRVMQKVEEAAPDVLLITGDLVDFRDIPESAYDPLRDWLARSGRPCYYCIGNHERYVDLEAICARLTRAGVTVLRNRSVAAGGIQYLGIDDAENRFQVASELRTLAPMEEHFRILLYHRPDGAEAAAQWGAHLMLTGHTHNGQIVPFNLLVRRVFPRICGNYDIDGMKLYVSPGTGTWGPLLRLGSRAEITLFRLT